MEHEEQIATRRDEQAGSTGAATASENQTDPRVDDGGPAFPLFAEYEHDSGVVVREFQFGMSLRDYFAAHAPRKPQDWYEPVMPPKPEPEYDHEHSYDRHGCYSIIDGSQTCAALNAAERRRWDAEWRKQHRVQWPYAYADAMLKARGER